MPDVSTVAARLTTVLNEVEAQFIEHAPGVNCSWMSDCGECHDCIIVDDVPVLALIAKARKVIAEHEMALRVCGCDWDIPPWCCRHFGLEAEAWGVSP